MMKNAVRRGTSLLLSLVLLACVCLPGVSPARAWVPDYPNTHTNTGNQRADILAVALTQMGYTEGPNNATKYGAWGGFPNQPWCANFVSWCARQAEISQTVLKNSPVASPKRFGIPHFDGAAYTPQPGDLFFTKELSHVGLVYYTEGDFFYTVEGNVNIDENEDGYFVMTLKRKISDYYFGVPAYEGGDKDHDYVRHVESEHPHKSYYQCDSCGDKYYTGCEVTVTDCAKCVSCGCDRRYAGYYISSGQKGTFYIRAEHWKDDAYAGCLIQDAVVYVHGIDYNAGLAFIEYDGILGHYPIKYLKKYYGAPAQPSISVAQKTYVDGDDVTVQWSKSTNAEEYRLTIQRDGEMVVNELVGTAQTYTLTAAQAGSYEISVTAANRTGWSQSAVASVWVRSRCTVSFDAMGGTGEPGEIAHLAGDPLILPQQTPQREGYVFLGWTAEQGSSLAAYSAGSRMECDADLTLYAVWREESAQPTEMTIETQPRKQMFCLGDELDTSGLVLRVYYSDGTAALISDGFTVEGFSSEETGVLTLTVTCQGLTAEYDVEIVTHFPGDINLDDVVNRDDVMALLWHITFPDQFPITVPADFTGDDKVNRDDVMHLLWHITFPEMFPLR